MDYTLKLKTEMFNKGRMKVSFSFINDNDNTDKNEFIASFKNEEQFFKFINFKYGYLNKLNDFNLKVECNFNDAFNLNQETFAIHGFNAIEKKNKIKLDNSAMIPFNQKILNDNYSQIFMNVDSINKKRSILISNFRDGKLESSNGIVINTSLDITNKDKERIRDFIDNNFNNKNEMLFFKYDKNAASLYHLTLKKLKSMNSKLTLEKIQDDNFEFEAFQNYSYNKFFLHTEKTEEYILKNIKNVNLIYTDGSFNRNGIHTSSFITKTPDDFSINSLLRKHKARNCYSEELAFLEAFKKGIKDNIFNKKTFFVCDADSINVLFQSIKDNDISQYKKTNYYNILNSVVKDIYNKDNNINLNDVHVLTIKSHLAVNNIFQFGNNIVDVVAKKSSKLISGNFKNNTIIDIETKNIQKKFDEFLSKKHVTKTKNRLNALFSELKERDLKSLLEKEKSKTILIYELNIQQNEKSKLYFIYNSETNVKNFITLKKETLLDKVNSNIINSIQNNNDITFISNMSADKITDIFKNDILDNSIKENSLHNYSLHDLFLGLDNSKNLKHLKNYSFQSFLNIHTKKLFNKTFNNTDYDYLIKDISNDFKKEIDYLNNIELKIKQKTNKEKITANKGNNEMTNDEADNKDIKLSMVYGNKELLPLNNNDKIDDSSFLIMKFINKSMVIAQIEKDNIYYQKFPLDNNYINHLNEFIQHRDFSHKKNIVISLPNATTSYEFKDTINGIRHNDCNSVKQLFNLYKKENILLTKTIDFYDQLKDLNWLKAFKSAIDNENAISYEMEEQKRKNRKRNSLK